MEWLLLFGLALLGLALVGRILGRVGQGKGARRDREIETLKEQVKGLRANIRRLDELAARQATRKRVTPGAEQGAPQPTPSEGEAPPVPEAIPVPAPQPAPPPVPEPPSVSAVEEEAEAAAQAASEEPSALEPRQAASAAEPAVARPRRLDAEWWARFESAVGKRWMTYLGGLALFAAVGFFVKYSIDKFGIDRTWAGPGPRVVAGLLFGAAIIALGERFVRRDMRLLGLGLIGAAGLPILYVSLFAAFGLYALIPQWAAFAAMVAVTIVGMTLAIRHDSLVVSFLALLGGLITPLLVSTGALQAPVVEEPLVRGPLADPRDLLFGYLLILDLGVLGVAFFRRWRALDVLAFVGTVVYFAGWFAGFYTDAAMVAALVWLGAFYLTFVVLPFANHLRDATPTTLERFIMAVLVATAVFGCAYLILHPEHPHVLGFWALGMSACYASVGALARRRIPADVRGAFCFLAFAMTFLTIAVPLHLGLNGITLAWAAEAVLLLYLGYRFAYLPVRLGGLVVLALTVARLFTHHWPLHPGPFALIGNVQFGVAAFVCLAVGAFSAVHHRWREQSGDLDALFKLLCALGAGVLGLVVLHAEVGSWFAHKAEQYAASPVYLSRSAGAVVWALGSLAFLGAGFRAKSLASRLTGLAALIAAQWLAASIYEAGLVETWRHFRNARFGAALAVVAAAFAHGLVLRHSREAVRHGERRLGEYLCLAAGAGLLLALSWELGGWLGQWSRYHAECGLVALWALGSVAFLVAGIRGRSLAWRAAGLIVLLVAVIGGACLYEAGLLKTWRHFRNARFGAALAVVAAAFAHGLVLRHSREAVRHGERRLGEYLCLAAGAGLLLALSWELGGWLGQWSRYHAECGLVALWALGSVAFLVAGIRGRSLAWRAAGLIVLLVAVIGGACLYEAGLLKTWRHFRNARFGVSLLVVATLFGHGLVLRRFREACSEWEKDLVEPLCLAGGLALLGALSVELHGWLGVWSRHYARCGVAALWAAGSVAFVFAGCRVRAVGTCATGLLVLLAGLVQGVALYEPGLLEQYRHFLNVRFAVAVLASAAMFASGLLLHRSRESLPARTQRVGEWLSVAAGLALLLALNVDLYLWLALTGRYEARCGIAALSALGSAGFLAAGVRARSVVPRVVGVSILAVACVLARWLFEDGLVEQFTLYVNLRFGTCLLAVALIFVFGRVLGGCREVCTPDERKFAPFLNWVAAFLLLAILSVDAYLYAGESAAGAREARWSSQMALSITWSVYAMLMLVVGFWRRLRTVRLAALGLFLLTLLKLALVDLAILHQQEIYRILSFFVVGLLMVGTSYLYHRVEKHLEKQWQGSR